MRGSSLRGTKKSETCKARMREGIRQAIARGVPFGKLHARPFIKIICKQCGKEKETRNQRQIYCGQFCALKAAHENNRKIPKENKIKELYLQGVSSTKIGEMYGVGHHSIIFYLQSRGIKTRTRNERFKHTICKVEGCEEPIAFYWHRKFQKWYGTECEGHKKERQRKWFQQKQQTIKQS